MPSTYVNWKLESKDCRAFDCQAYSSQAYRQSIFGRSNIGIMDQIGHFRRTNIENEIRNIWKNFQCDLASDHGAVELSLSVRWIHSQMSDQLDESTSKAGLTLFDFLVAVSFCNYWWRILIECMKSGIIRYIPNNQIDTSVFNND